MKYVLLLLTLALLLTGCMQIQYPIAVENATRECHLRGHQIRSLEARCGDKSCTYHVTCTDNVSVAKEFKLK